MTAQAPLRPAQSDRCSRCGGRFISDVDGRACLMCGWRDYGPRFRPLGLDPADARPAVDALNAPEASAWAESEPEGPPAPVELLET